MTTSDEFTDALILLRKWKDEGVVVSCQSDLFSPEGHWISSESDESPIRHLGDYPENSVYIFTKERMWTLRPNDVQEVGDSFLRWSIKTGWGNRVERSIRVVEKEGI